LVERAAGKLFLRVVFRPTSRTCAGKPAVDQRRGVVKMEIDLEAVALIALTVPAWPRGTTAQASTWTRR